MQSNASLQSANCQKIENIINCKITQQDFKKVCADKGFIAIFKLRKASYIANEHNNDTHAKH